MQSPAFSAARVHRSLSVFLDRATVWQLPQRPLGFAAPAAGDGNPQRHAGQLLRWRADFSPRPGRHRPRASNWWRRAADSSDVGGESTRPIPNPSTPAPSWPACCAVMEAVPPHVLVPMSIDTSKAAVRARPPCWPARRSSTMSPRVCAKIRGMISRGQSKARPRLRDAHARHAADDAGQSDLLTTSWARCSSFCAARDRLRVRRHSGRADRARPGHRLRQDPSAQPDAGRTRLRIARTWLPPVGGALAPSVHRQGAG